MSVVGLPVFRDSVNLNLEENQFAQLRPFWGVVGVIASIETGRVFNNSTEIVTFFEYITRGGYVIISINSGASLAAPQK